MKSIYIIAITCLFFIGCSTSSAPPKSANPPLKTVTAPSTSKAKVKTAKSIQKTKPTVKVATSPKVESTDKTKSSNSVMHQYFRDMVRRSPSKLTTCTIHFHRGLPKEFNLYNSWPSFCNSVKDMELFRHTAYKQYGPKGLLHYPEFEKDFRRLQSMTIAEAKKRAASQPKKTYSSSSGGKCHYVRGYRRKSGTYVRGHTRCR